MNMYNPYTSSFKGLPIMKKLIGYLRVSTKQQGASGLGIEGQRTTVENYAKQNGAEIAFWYTEVESGKRSDRPQLAKALTHARRIKALLVVAKVDRLARNARFLLTVLEGGADVAFCDFPNIPAGPTGKFILTQMAAVAELEAGLISQRTRDALAAYKSEGGKLGAELPQCRNLTQVARVKGAQAAGKAATKAADEAYSVLLPLVLQHLRNEAKTLQEIAGTLNSEGHTTRRGKAWNHVQVLRLLARAEVKA